MADQIHQILDIVHPLPASVDAGEADDGLDQVRAERDRYAAHLAAAEDNSGTDPLLTALTDATQRLETARNDQRRLLALGRAFNRGRPYTREQLAEACGGRSEGWVRSTVTDADIAAVARLLRTEPLRGA